MRVGGRGLRALTVRSVPPATNASVGATLENAGRIVSSTCGVVGLSFRWKDPFWLGSGTPTTVGLVPWGPFRIGTRVNPAAARQQPTGEP